MKPSLFGTPAYYAALASGEKVDTDLRYNKRDKDVHRYVIACDGAPMALTVPVAHSAGACTPGGLKWSDIRVSAHGRWWETHARTLATAYGASPFFEYYFPKFSDIFSESRTGQSVAELIADVDVLMLKALGLDALPAGAVAAMSPYHQTIPCASSELSALDLLFNTGPEAPLHLFRIDLQI